MKSLVHHITDCATVLSLVVADKTFAFFALFADYKASVSSVLSVASAFNDADTYGYAIHVGAASAANDC